MSTALKQKEKPLSGALKVIFEELSSEPKQKNARLARVWPQIVGNEVAKKTKVKFNHSGVSVIAGNSSFAFELSRKFGDLILKRLQNEFGEKEIQKIWISVGRMD